MVAVVNVLCNYTEGQMGTGIGYSETSIFKKINNGCGKIVSRRRRK
jgi:hypothetical protein